MALRIAIEADIRDGISHIGSTLDPQRGGGVRRASAAERSTCAALRRDDALSPGGAGRFKQGALRK